MAGDLLRAVAVIDACTSLITATTATEQQPVTRRISSAVTAELDTRSRGDQKSLTIAAATSEARSIIAETIDDHAAALAALTGLPLAAMRTSAGWRAALSTEGHDLPRRLTRAAVNRLPGTFTANSVSTLMTLTTTLDAVDDGAWNTHLEHAWHAPVETETFDAAVTRAQQTNPSASELAWSLVTFESHKHVNLIWHQANKLERSFPDRTAEDLLGWGWVGLRAALRHYNPTLGYTFSTYACTRIVGAIRDGVRAENPVPKRLNTFSRKAAAAEAELTQRLGRAPTPEEVSASIGVELSTLDILHRTQPQASIDEIIGMLAERGSAPRWLVTGDDPAQKAIDEVLADAVRTALEQLPADEATAVRLLVMDGMNPTEARSVTGATARQLRQRKERALAVLKEALSDWDEHSPGLNPHDT